MAKTWGELFRDPVLIVALVIMFQFFALILVFAIKPNNIMNDAAKATILQTYVIAFTAAWGYYIGASINGARVRIADPKPPTGVAATKPL